MEDKYFGYEKTARGPYNVAVVAGRAGGDASANGEGETVLPACSRTTTCTKLSPCAQYVHSHCSVVAKGGSIPCTSTWADRTGDPMRERTVHALRAGTRGAPP